MNEIGSGIAKQSSGQGKAIDNSAIDIRGKQLWNMVKAVSKRKMYTCVLVHQMI